MSTRLPFLLLAFALSACQSADTKGTSERPGEEPISGAPAQIREADVSVTEPSIRFAESMAEAVNGNFQSTFRLLAQRDIVTKFSFPRSSLPGGVLLVHFSILNSEGVEHASKWYALTAAPDAPATIRHPLFDKEMPVQMMDGDEGVSFFYGKIPVAGTNFTRYRLHGEFSAQLRIGVEEADALVTQTFEVKL